LLLDFTRHSADGVQLDGLLDVQLGSPADNADVGAFQLEVSGTHVAMSIGDGLNSDA
jgi:hypothetical protein